jgi:hypothetical protein
VVTADDDHPIERIRRIAPVDHSGAAPDHQPCLADESMVTFEFSLQCRRLGAGAGIVEPAASDGDLRGGEIDQRIRRVRCRRRSPKGPVEVGCGFVPTAGGGGGAREFELRMHLVERCG